MAKAKRARPSYSHVDGMTARAGWFQPYLLAVEDAIWGRWRYWIDVCTAGDIGDQPIPQIPFGMVGSPERPQWPDLGPAAESLGTSAEAGRHVTGIFERCYSRGDRLDDIVDWWLYGFGSPRVPDRPRLSEDTAVDLYHLLEIQRLIAHPADWSEWLARDYISHHAKQWSGWFATPMNVARMMAAMQFTDAEREGTDCRGLSVCDPTCGTGVMLLAASNYSLNLYGQDNWLLMCRLCEFNGFLFAPWLVYGHKASIRGLHLPGAAEAPGPELPRPAIDQTAAPAASVQLGLFS